MSGRINDIYYFDYTRDIGYYDSVRDFSSLEMEFIAMAVSTEKVSVNATPLRYKIPIYGSEQIREYAISNMNLLVEISKELADNSPRYILIRYGNGRKVYYKYNETFCEIFDIAKRYKPQVKKDPSFDEIMADILGEEAVKKSNEHLLSLINGTSNTQKSSSASSPTEKIATAERVPLFCGYCGSKLVPNGSFCPKCGKKTLQEKNNQIARKINTNTFSTMDLNRGQKASSANQNSKRNFSMLIKPAALLFLVSTIILALEDLSFLSSPLGLFGWLISLLVYQLLAQLLAFLTGYIFLKNKNKKMIWLNYFIWTLLLNLGRFVEVLGL